MVGLCVVIASLIILIVYDNSDEAELENYFSECEAWGGEIVNFKYPPPCILENCPERKQVFPYCDFTVTPGGNGKPFGVK